MNYASSYTSGSTNDHEFSTDFGWLCVLVAIVFWGLFATPMKSERVLKADLHPLVFGWYMSVAIAVSSMFILFVKPWAWTWYGFYGAVLWTLGNDFAMLAIASLGLGAAQSIWAGLICIVSFGWGVYGRPLWGVHSSCVLSSGGLAATGLGLIIVGIVAIVVSTSVLNEYIPEEEASSGDYEAFMSGLTETLHRPSQHGDDEANLLSPESPGGLRTSGLTPRKNPRIRKNSSYSALPALSGSFSASFNSEPDQGGFESPKATAKAGGAEEEPAGGVMVMLRGVVCALGTAVFAGSCLVPVNLNEDAGGPSGLVYSVSFGISAWLVASCFCALHYAYATVAGEDYLVWHTDPMVILPCFASGILWNTGNVASVLCTLSPLGLTIGYPVMQLAMIVSGIAGIVVFREVRGYTAIGAFMAASCVTGAGAVLLGMYGACKE